jgi:hypothetical protein
MGSFHQYLNGDRMLRGVSDAAAQGDEHAAAFFYLP